MWRHRSQTSPPNTPSPSPCPPQAHLHATISSTHLTGHLQLHPLPFFDPPITHVQIRLHRELALRRDASRRRARTTHTHWAATLTLSPTFHRVGLLADAPILTNLAASSTATSSTEPLLWTFHHPLPAAPLPRAWTWAACEPPRNKIWFLDLRYRVIAHLYTSCPVQSAHLQPVATFRNFPTFQHNPCPNLPVQPSLSSSPRLSQLSLDALSLPGSTIDSATPVSNSQDGGPAAVVSAPAPAPAPTPESCGREGGGGRRKRGGKYDPRFVSGSRACAPTLRSPDFPTASYSSSSSNSRSMSRRQRRRRHGNISPSVVSRLPDVTLATSLQLADKSDGEDDHDHNDHHGEQQVGTKVADANITPLQLPSLPLDDMCTVFISIRPNVTLLNAHITIAFVETLTITDDQDNQQVQLRHLHQMSHTKLSSTTLLRKITHSLSASWLLPASILSVDESMDHVTISHHVAVTFSYRKRRVFGRSGPQVHARNDPDSWHMPACATDDTDVAVLQLPLVLRRGVEERATRQYQPPPVLTVWGSTRLVAGVGTTEARMPRPPPHWALSTSSSAAAMGSTTGAQVSASVDALRELAYARGGQRRRKSSPAGRSITWRFPTFVAHASLEDRRCFLCLEKLHGVVMMLPCLHVGHRKCMQRLQPTLKACPVCRLDLTPFGRGDAGVEG